MKAKLVKEGLIRKIYEDWDIPSYIEDDDILMIDNYIQSIIDEIVEKYGHTRSRLEELMYAKDENYEEILDFFQDNIPVEDAAKHFSKIFQEDDPFALSENTGKKDDSYENYIIIASGPWGDEIVDYADSPQEAESLAMEYQESFGGKWEVTWYHNISDYEGEDGELYEGYGRKRWSISRVESEILEPLAQKLGVELHKGHKKKQDGYAQKVITQFYHIENLPIMVRDIKVAGMGHDDVELWILDRDKPSKGIPFNSMISYAGFQEKVMKLLGYDEEDEDYKPFSRR